MLFLTRDQNELFHIGDEITVKVIDINSQRIKTATTICGETTTQKTAIGQRLHLTDSISILMTLSRKEQARLGITAPERIPVHRSEVLNRIMRNLRQLSIFEIWANPKDQQSPPISSYIAARDQGQALTFFNEQHRDREWMITPWVVNTHWQPDLMRFVDAGMDSSAIYQALRTAALLSPAPFFVSLPHLNSMEAAA